MTKSQDQRTRREQPGNQTPNTPNFRESDLHDLRVDELRERAKDLGVSRSSELRKDDLIHEITRAATGDGGDSSAAADATPDGGGIRTGPETSKSLRHSQEITSPQDEPERPGRSLATTSHDVIRQWAEARGAVPATVPGTEHGDRLGVLRFDFPGYGGEGLREVSWDEWFETFDERRLNFLYQEERADGTQSNFFRLESPDREDA